MERTRLADHEQTYLQCLEGMQKLRHFDGDPAKFWRTYLAELIPICSASTAIIAARAAGSAPGFRPLAVFPDSMARAEAAESVMEGIAGLVAQCVENGAAQSDTSIQAVLVVKLQTDVPDNDCVAAFFTDTMSSEEAAECLRRLRLVADVPASYQLSRVAAESRTRVQHFANVLDLMTLLNEEKRFLPAAMTFCNELATRHGAERVSLGWLEKGYIKVQAISRVDKFDRKTEAVQKLEAAMEEAIDQNAEIVIPSAEAGGPVHRDHAAYMAALDVSHMCTLPLREEGEVTAACSLERSGAAFTETELRLVRLSCDQASRRLADLKRNDRWFGARAASWLQEKLAGLLGYEHTWAKVLGIVVFALLAAFFLVPAPYRVKAAVTLRTDELAHLTAPFDGHIDKVFVRVGDTVKRGQELLGLDQTDLLLREADLVAEKGRYDREVEKARGNGALADMQIAAALRDQSAARLGLARYQASQAVIRAPFDGVIVEGDLMEKIGAPVRQGEPLFKLGRIENLYAELEVNEADIRQVAVSMSGEAALESRPQERFPLRVTRIEPVAVPREKRNVFIVKAEFTAGARDWWRPGMSGVARLDAGRRTLMWLATHRTADFLRLRLWW
jgi:multidrug efflux pump subunit AcrA (membrane-fusion protein)